jgi:hypothetical protein
MAHPQRARHQAPQIRYCLEKLDPPFDRKMQEVLMVYRRGTASILGAIDLHSDQIFASVEDRHRSVAFIALLRRLDAHHPPLRMAVTPATPTSIPPTSESNP